MREEMVQAIKPCGTCEGRAEVYGNVTEDRMGWFPCPDCTDGYTNHEWIDDEGRARMGERQVWACDCGFVTTVAHLAESHGTGPAFSRSSFKGKHIVRPYVPEADLQTAIDALEEIEALKFDPFKSMARAALDRIGSREGG